MVDVIEVDPNSLEIDPVNERRGNLGPDDLEQNLVDSVRKQGVIQPPLVRKHEDTYKVIVGQRRTLAAQVAGVDTIPVVVVDYDDTDATLASITENVDAFKNSVSRTDRAAAIKRLQEINGWNINQVAEQLGINSSVVSEWLERTRPEWQDTNVHVESSNDTSEEQQETVDDVDDKSLGTIRRATGGGEEGQQIVEKVAKNNLSQSQVIEAEKRSRRGEDFEQVLDEMSQEKKSRDGDIKVNVNVTFTGEYAEALREDAKKAGTSEQQVVKGAIEDYLQQNGLL